MFQIFELPNLEKAVYEAPSLSVLSPVLSTESAPRRAAGRETLTELLFADIGDEVAKTPYLIVRDFFLMHAYLLLTGTLSYVRRRTT